MLLTKTFQAQVIVGSTDNNSIDSMTGCLQAIFHVRRSGLGMPMPTKFVDLFTISAPELLATNAATTLSLKSENLPFSEVSPLRTETKREEEKGRSDHRFKPRMILVNYRPHLLQQLSSMIV